MDALDIERLPSPSGRPSTLARLLASDIAGGRYRVGDKLPTEAELQKRFAASRYSVREALRSLKESGLVVSTAGVGTVVRAFEPTKHRYMQGFGTLRELIQIADDSRLRLLAQRTLVTDEADAARLDVGAGEQWIEAIALRYSTGQQLPTCSVLVYVRPEHAEVIDRIDTSPLTIHGMIEKFYSVRIAEVRQSIDAVSLTPELAERLKAEPTCAALRITRRFMDAQDRLVLVSVGTYPHDRFTHDTVFRVLQS